MQPTRLCPWGFSRQEYWSGLSFPPPGNLPDPGIEPRSLTFQADSLPSEPPGKPRRSREHGWKLQPSHHRADSSGNQFPSSENDLIGINSCTIERGLLRRIKDSQEIISVLWTLSQEWGMKTNYFFIISHCHPRLPTDVFLIKGLKWWGPLQEV